MELVAACGDTGHHGVIGAFAGSRAINMAGGGKAEAAILQDEPATGYHDAASETLEDARHQCDGQARFVHDHTANRIARGIANGWAGTSHARCRCTHKLNPGLRIRWIAVVRSDPF